MNREERRKMMKKIPGYKKIVKTATNDAVDKLEEMFRKNWDNNDSNMNNGELWHERKDDEDDIYNL